MSLSFESARYAWLSPFVDLLVVTLATAALATAAAYVLVP